MIEKRIQDVIHKGGNFLYKPRSAGGGFHKHESKMSKENADYLRDKLEHLLHFFGYVKDEREGGLNNFEFYDYKGKASKESVDAYMDFERVNKMMLKRRIKQV